jgi:hypothetical protein
MAHYSSAARNEGSNHKIISDAKDGLERSGEEPREKPD